MATVRELYLEERGTIGRSPYSTSREATEGNEKAGIKDHRRPRRAQDHRLKHPFLPRGRPVKSARHPIQDGSC